MKRIVGSAAVAATLFATAAHAQEAPAEEAPGTEPAAADSVPANSINLSPLGLLFGSYALNYEHMLPGGHGLLVEGLLTSTDDGDTSSLSYGGALGYRFHFNGTQDSWFAGANVGYQLGSGTAKVEVTQNGMTSSSEFDVDTTALTATANIGRRWAWDFGLNVTLRIGAGYASYDVTTDSDDPDAQEAVQLVDDLLSIIPVALDGELSVGWVF